MRTPKSAALIPIVLLLAMTVAVAATANPLSQLKDQLICQCGCNLVLASCQDMMECGVAQRMTDEVAARLDAGEPPSQIVASFVARYGKAVLSAPPKAGFDLTAWVTPFVALIGGLVLLSFIVREFARRGRQHREAVSASVLELSPEERERLRRRLREELKDYV